MKLPFLCLFAAHAFADIYVGPQFHYTNIEFNNPTELKGYSAGVTAGIDWTYCYFYSDLVFEGTWNAGPIVGTPCQRSDLQEYFLELKLGGNFCFCCDQFSFKPYTGIGWDRFENTQDPKTAALCYRWDKIFVPVGFLLRWDYCCTNSLGLQFEWRPDVWTKLHLLSIDLDAKCEQAFRGALPFRFYREYCSCCFWTEWSPFFDWNEFGRADEKNSNGVPLPIPNLKRWNLGLRFLIGYQF